MIVGVVGVRVRVRGPGFSPSGVFVHGVSYFDPFTSIASWVGWEGAPGLTPDDAFFSGIEVQGMRRLYVRPTLMGPKNQCPGNVKRVTPHQVLEVEESDRPDCAA